MNTAAMNKTLDKMIPVLKDVCSAYINKFNQDAVGLLVSQPMRFVTKVSEVY